MAQRLRMSARNPEILGSIPRAGGRWFLIRRRNVSCFHLRIDCQCSGTMNRTFTITMTSPPSPPSHPALKYTPLMSSLVTLRGPSSSSSEEEQVARTDQRGKSYTLTEYSRASLTPSPPVVCPAARST